MEVGKKKSFTHNLMSTAHIFSENEDPTHPVSDLTDDTSETWFQPESSELPVEITNLSGRFIQLRVSGIKRGCLL